MDKVELRRYIRKEKKRYGQDELEDMSQRICSILIEHPRILNASVVLLYWALPDEVRTEILLNSLVDMGKTVLLPRVVSDTEMSIHLFTSTADMKPGSYGILEPVGPVVDISLMNDMFNGSLEDCCVAVVPGMAFDKEGHRLGRGKGYYDRFFATMPHFYRIGICFPFQLQPVVPCEQQDIIMDEVIC